MDGEELKQRLVAILAADVVGYSRLMGSDERATVAALDAARAVFRRLIEANQGRVVDMAGDSVLAVFETAAGAVLTALAVQEELNLSSTSLADDRRMRYRIGIHLGDVIEKADGTVYGNGVNVAARLESLARPGGVTVSDIVYEAVRDRIATRFEEAGAHIVKNIERPVRALHAFLGSPEYSIHGTATHRAPLARRTGWIDSIFHQPKRAWAMAAALLLLLLFSYGWMKLSGPLKARSDNKEAAIEHIAKRSIAVLPFKGSKNAGGGNELARNVAADLASELARSPDLRVVSTQSSFRFSGSEATLSEIGERLRTRYVVDGTVRRDAEKLQIRVELIDSQDGRIVWTSSHTVDHSTLSVVQMALVSRIAGTLQSKVSRTEEQRALLRAPKTLDVYVLTARGKSLMHQYSPQGMRESRYLYEQALSIDPNYAPAWAYLGIANTIDIGLNLTGDWDKTRIDEVLSQVRRAIALQPELPIAYVALSQAQGLAENFEAALAAAQQVCQLSPNDADCFFARGKAQLDIGQVEGAARDLTQAIDRNPIPPAYLPAFYATALWGSKRFKEAVRAADDCLAQAPEFWRCRQDRIAALVELGKLDDAKHEAARLLARVPQMTADQFGFVFSEVASTLRKRRVTAAKAAGIPRMPNDPNARSNDTR